MAFLYTPSHPGTVPRPTEKTSAGAASSGAGRVERAAVPPPKVRIPFTTAASVTRQRLMRLIPAEPPAVPGEGPDVLLLCAPAGSGKTTLLADWARQVAVLPDAEIGEGRPGEESSGKQEEGTGREGAGTEEAGTVGARGRAVVAWVSLDADDNDVFRLWSALLTSLEATGAWGPGSTLHRLAPPHGPVEPGFLAAVARALEEATARVWLVLDDTQELHDPDALHSLGELLRITPGGPAVVLSGREEPPLALHRLRLEGRVREIPAHELTFTREEAERLLDASGVRLPPDRLGLLVDRTEGWAAGLRLAALSLPGAPDPSAVIGEFSGDDRGVTDYIVGEVVHHLPAHVRRFLLDTSVCDRLSVGLAAALSGRGDAGEILDRLERGNVLTVRLGRTGDWYRYHSLLLGCLRAELRRGDMAAWLRLHRTAARWYAGHGMPDEALEHAVASEDPDLAAELIEAHGPHQILGRGGAPLRRLLAGAPAGLTARPAVALVSALASLLSGDRPGAEARLHALGRTPADHPQRALRVLHASIEVNRARLGGDVPAALARLDAVGTGPTGNPDIDLIALVGAGTARMWLGDHDTAERNLTDALRLAGATGLDYLALVCLGNLGAVASCRSDLGGTDRRARAAVEFAASRGWEHTSTCAFPFGLLAWAAHQRLDTRAAREYASTAMSLLHDHMEATVELSVRATDAAVAADTAGDAHSAAARMHEVWLRMDRRHSPPSLIAYSAPAVQRLALQVGETAWAVGAVQRTRTLLGPGGEWLLLRAVARAHGGRPDAARRVLRPVLNGSAPCVVATTAVHAWLLEAVLAERSGNTYRSHEAVARALEAAAPREILRPFRDAGETVRTLIARGTGRFGRHEAFAARLLTALPVPSAAPAALTASEQRLLLELPSMRTTEEIAAALHVSPNTVKTHLRGIYRKLGVRSRRDAITAARRRGLL